MPIPNVSPNIEDRFSKIDIENKSKTPRSQPITKPKYPNLSTSRRAETRGISRSSSSNNLSQALNGSRTPTASKTPSKTGPVNTPKSLLTARKPSRKQLNNLVPHEAKLSHLPLVPPGANQMSYMRDTSSSSLKKMSSPFYSGPSSINRDLSLHSLHPQLHPEPMPSTPLAPMELSSRYPNITPRRVVSNTKPSDITNLHYEKGGMNVKTPSKRHVSQPFTDPPKMDVYTRLYNDSKSKPAPTFHRPNPNSNPPPPNPNMSHESNGKRGIRRTFSSFQLDKQIHKVQSLSDLYRIIYEEDKTLFEGVEADHFEASAPKLPQDLIAVNPSEDQGSSLDVYERGEILRRKDIYFVPNPMSDSQRKINIRNYNNNYGFDDNAGNYVIIPNDHINYRYEITSVLGNGSFGNVVRCSDKKFSDPATGKNKTVAIKIIKNDLNWSLQAVYEIKMLKHLNGQRQVNSNDPYTNEYGDHDCPVLTYFDHFHFRGHMCIVTEGLSINLYSMLEIIKFQGLSLDLLKVFIRKTLQGLQYIHSMSVLHCDIKPENIMIQMPSNFPVEDLSEESFKLKIIDFGTSCFTNEVSYSYIQSRFYRAPEVILGAKYDKMIDIWSLGCIIAELFTGDPLLPGKNELEQIELILELFGNPNSTLILQQRNQLLKSIKGKRSTNRFDESVATNPNLLNAGVPDERSIKKTLLYTLFDMEGKINMQFLNMRAQAAANNTINPISSRKMFKISSKNLETALKLRSCNEDKRNITHFLQFLNSIFKWNPEERADCTQLLQDPFLSI